MVEMTEEKVLEDVIKILNELTSDWEYNGEVTKDTRLYYDLGFESIDAVALGTAVEEYYRQAMPYAEFLTELGQEGIESLTVGKLVKFIHQNLGASKLGE